MFKKIKDFFFGNKPAATVEETKDVPLTTVDVAIKNIKETTESVTDKVEVAPAPAPEVKETPWIEKAPAPIAKKPAKTQNVKATTAPKKKRPAGK